MQKGFTVISQDFFYILFNDDYKSYLLRKILSQRIQKFLVNRSKNTEEYKYISKNFYKGVAEIFGLLWIDFLEIIPVATGLLLTHPDMLRCRTPPSI